MNIISLMIRFLFACLFLPAVSVAGNQDQDPLKILVLGDSLTAGYGLDIGDAFPAQLERALQSAGHHVIVINAGVSGDTTAGGLARLDWVLSDRPQLVILELGANDALRGLPPEQTRQNLEAIILRLQKEKMTVLLAGMRAPRNFDFSYYNKFDRIFPELAKQYGVAFYPFFLEGVATIRRYNLDDGIHPNTDGVAVIVQGILPTVEQLLNQR